LVQKWNWVGRGRAKGGPPQFRPLIETELHRFERFQLGE
jgi:uncharacterized protein